MTVVAPTRPWPRNDDDDDRRREAWIDDPITADPIDTDPTEADSSVGRISAFIDAWPTVSNPDELAGALDVIRNVSIDALARRPEALAARYLLTLIPRVGESSAQQLAFSRELALRLPPQSTFGFGLDAPAHLTTAAALVLVLQREGRFAQAAELACASIQRVDSLGVEEFARTREIVPWLLMVSGQTLLSFERMAESITLLERVRDSDALFPRFAATSLLLAAYALDGRLGRTLSLFREVWSIGESRGWMRNHYASAALTGLAIAQGALRDLDQQAATVAALRATAQALPQWLLAADLIDVSTLIARGHIADALALLNDRLRGADPSDIEPIIRNLVWFARAEVILADGRPGAVITELRAAPLSPNHIGCHGSLRAFAYVSLNLPAEALAATETCVSLAHEHSLRTLQNVFFARAAAFMLLDRKDAAMRDLWRGLLAASVGGYGVIEQLPLIVMRRLSAEASARGIRLPTHFDEVLRRDESGVDDCFERFGALSARERAILPDLRSGDTIEVLARRLFISENTLKAHIHHICAKLRVSTREEAILAVERFGYLDLA